MAESSTHAWLTSVLTSKDVAGALTLACSLWRASSCRKVGVIVSPKLSFEMKKILHNCFNYVFYLDDDFNSVGLKQEDFVKIYCLTLTCFSKCVYLSPNMLVLKNCDEQFQQPDSLEWMNTSGMACFEVRPSLERFYHLMDSFHVGRVEDVERFLRTWTNAETSPVKFLGTKSNTVLNQSGILNWNVSVVNLADIQFDMDLENCGIFEKLILKYQKLIIEEDVQLLLNSPEQKSAICRPLKQLGAEPVAIIGMSCRYPTVSNPEEFWNLIISKNEGITTPPNCRWTTNLLSSSDAHYRQTRAGFLNYPVDEFDAKFFNISPKEMLFLDPQQRLLLELVWESLEDSGLNPQKLRGTNGSVFLGASSMDYKEMLYETGVSEEEYYRTYMGNSFGAAAARLSFFLGMTGPSIATESGCSSGMVAVHLACKSLQERETNLSLACGVNLLLHPFDKELMPMVLSETGACKTWDAAADGFVRAEGGGVLVLKRVSDAIRDGDNILALIRGSAISQEGTSRSMGTPTVLSESLAMSQALENAGVLPEQVSFVETHGTGTPVGDPLEIEAIAKAYHSPNRKEPLLIGSVKTNVGHTESCSGITGIMKVVLAMQNQVIPPHRNFEKLNPAIDLEAVPAKIPLQPVKWQKEKGIPRLAGVSSFGITGTDAHVILEEPPTQPTSFYAQVNEWERPLHPMKISAKTNEALNTLLENYKTLLANTSEHFKDVTHSANVGRADFGHRAVLLASSTEDAVEQLEKKNFRSGEASSEERLGNICFLFTGQGSQYAGMAHQLFETSPVFRFHFEYCANLLKKKYNIDITKALWVRKLGEEVKKTIYSQTSIFCVELALLRLWESWGVRPDYVIGHSLGEFAAAVCAGILSVEDALQLVAERSKLIERLPPGEMLVVKASLDRVKEVMKNFAQFELDIAAVNSDEQTVLAGSSELVLEFSQFCIKSGVKCVVLEATHAFHSKHMEPILNQYKKVAASIKHPVLRDEKRPIFISGLLGSVIEPCDVDSTYWVRHTREQVEFLGASKKAVELGCRTFIEIGPQPVLSALTMMNSDKSLICLPSLKKTEGEWETLLSSLTQLYINGMEIDWKGLDTLYKRKKTKVPHYPFNRKPYWPEMLKKSAPTLHPLLGSIISNPSPTNLYQASLNLKKLEYLRDHAIGKNIIFPATGYLEMCLAAGLATIQGSKDSLAPPNLPMMIENVVIKAPLSLKEGEMRQIQTVAELNGTSHEVKCEIFQLTKSGWFPHATATFHPFVPDTHQQNENLFGATELYKIFEAPPTSSEDDIMRMYESLGDTGFHYGPTFRRIEKIWKITSNTLVAKVKALPEGNSSGYIIHPVLLDAMIQAIALAQPLLYNPKKLYVPIKIGKLVWLSPVNHYEEIYITVLSSPAESYCAAHLLNANGTLLAVMSSVELIETTVRGIDSFLEQQSISLPDMWEEVWKPRQTPAQFPMDTSKARGTFFTAEFAQRLQFSNDNPPAELLHTMREVEQLIYWNILWVLYDLGWAPQQHLIFEEDPFIKNLRVKDSLWLYLGFFMEVLETEGILSKVGESSQLNWKVVKMPPSQVEVNESLNSTRFSNLPSAQLLCKLGQQLSSILRGEEDALGTLFPTETSDCPSASEFYLTYGELFKVKEFVASIKTAWAAHVKGNIGNENVVMRVLEVGAGTGLCASLMLRAFTEQGLKLEYTYTDISATFFPAAENRFEEYAGIISFKKLNIEEDPISQGFAPEYYDVVLASEVIHATRNIKESLQNMRVLMKPHATLGLMETSSYSRLLTYMFGSLEGYWKFEDRELRKRHCYLSKTCWTQLLEQNGLRPNGVFSIFNDTHTYFLAEKYGHIPQVPTKKAWVVFTLNTHPISKFLEEKLGNYRTVILVAPSVDSIEETNLGGNKIRVKIRKDRESDFKILLESVQTKGLEIEGVVYCWAIELLETSQEQLLRPYSFLVKSILTTIPSFPRLYCLTTGVAPLPDNDMSSFHTATLWGFTRALKNENFGLTCKCIEVADENWGDMRCDEIFYELCNRREDVIVAFNKNTRYVPIFSLHKPKINALTLPQGSERFQLAMPESKTFADLQFQPLPPSGELQQYHVEIQVRAAALNFRDILSVLKPVEEFRNVNSVADDFAGVIQRVGDKVTKWKVGDEVFGLNTYMSPMPSHRVLHEDVVLRVPQDWTFSEAATIPTVYMTSILCLLDVAKIKKEDIVLIHTASGGVGLSAIQICKHIGCTVIATAGSMRKQNYLKETVKLKHIYHSRNTQFSGKILELTHGRGVDVVLNSLTGKGFKEASLKACATGARFVEMSKLNIWTTEEVREMRPDVEYTIADLSAKDEVQLKWVLQRVQELQCEGVVKPIPYTRFDALNIREALLYLQKAKHVGKVVCVMPRLQNEGGELKLYTPMFNDNSTYLITGGLGGIGLVVCRWMLKNGAKHVILASRKPPNTSTQRILNELNSGGAKLSFVQLDVSNMEQCQKLLEIDIPKLGLPKLRGIMHAAGTLADGLLQNLEWADFTATFKSKIDGSLNFHELTKQLQLEHFVLFSSVSALFGPPGQCNYAAGNMFEDALSHYRTSLGLPASTINWGLWAEVGVAQETDVPGLSALSNSHGIAGLEYVLKSGRTQTAILNVSSFHLICKVYPQLTHYFDKQILSTTTPIIDATISPEQFWREYDTAPELRDKITILKNRLRNLVRETLRHDQKEIIDDDADLQEMGVDSLMLVEIRNGLQTILGSRVSVNASLLKNCNTISLIGNKLVCCIEGVESWEANKRPTLEQVNALILKDCELPLHIKATAGRKIAGVGDIKTVLLTGCSGTLGPYVLKELTSLSQITQVVCLMRPPKTGSMDAKLSKILETTNLISKVDLRKVTFVAGNIAEANLGIERRLWTDLCEKVDAVFHCAASVIHTEHYTTQRFPNGCRAVNVVGTSNILEFATESRLKRVYYASSLLAVATVDEDGRLSENFPEVGNYDNLTTFAYPISKFVGDFLMKQGVERGIPCKVFRFPLLAGESHTGCCFIENNHPLLRYMFVMKNKIIPSNPIPIPVLPVDMCAEASVKLFFDERSPHDVYNISHHQPDADQEFVEVAKRFGYDVDVVDYLEFAERARSTAANGVKSPFSVFEEMYEDDDAIMELYTSTPSLKKWMEESQLQDQSIMWVSRKIHKYLPNFYESQERTMDYIYRDLCFIKRQGWFQKFGLE